MFDIRPALKIVGLFIKDHAPEILTGIGIAGMVTTAVIAVRETPEAVEELRKEEPETLVEEVKIYAKHYWVPMVTGTLSTICLIGSVGVSNRRNAALAAALTLSEDNFSQYKDKVKELFGERKEEKVREAINDDIVQDKVRITDKMIRTGTGQTLCLDLITGQTFWSDVDYIRKKFIEMNDFLQDNNTMDISDYCYILHIDDPQLIGHALGWKYDKHNRIELSATSTLKDDIPVFVIGHRNPPKYGYDK